MSSLSSRTSGFYIMTGDGDLPYLNIYRVRQSTAEQIARQHLEKHPECTGQIDVSIAHNHQIVFTAYRNEADGEIKYEWPQD